MITWKQGYYKWWDAYDENNKKLKVPSVSAVVDSKDDPELDKWIEEVGKEKAEQIMKAAADRGTAMHLFLENFYLAFAKGGGDLNKSLLYSQKKTPEQLVKEKIKETSIKTGRGMFYQLLEEFGAYNSFGTVNPNEHMIKKVIGLETMIANFELPYRGKYDINYIARLSDGTPINVLGDYKSSSSQIEKGSVKERKMKLQLSGYWNAYELMKSRELDFAILWVSIKGAGVQKIQIGREEYEDCFAEFKELCEHYHKINNQDLKMFKNYHIANG